MKECLLRSIPALQTIPISGPDWQGSYLIRHKFPGTKEKQRGTELGDINCETMLRHLVLYLDRLPAPATAASFILSSLLNQSTLKACYGMPVSRHSLKSVVWGRWKASHPLISQVFPLCTQITGNTANPQRPLAFQVVITNGLMRKGNSGQRFTGWILHCSALKGCFSKGRHALPPPHPIKKNTNARYKKDNLVALPVLWTHFLWLTSKWYKYFYLKGELQLSELGSDFLL